MPVKITDGADVATKYRSIVLGDNPTAYYRLDDPAATYAAPFWTDDFEEVASNPNTMVANLVLQDGFEGAPAAPAVYGSTILQSNDFETAPITAGYWHSLGTECLGTLAAWTTDHGTPSMASNVVTCAAGDAIRGGHPDWADCTISVRFVFTTGSQPFVTGRVTNAVTGNGYRFQTAGNNANLYRQDAGAFTQIAATTGVALASGTAYWFVLTFTGSTISGQIFADNAGAMGAQIGTTATATDATYANGQMGVGNNTAATASCTFGGAFANVCVVTGPAPTGWTTGLNAVTWGAANEPAFCWSKKQAYYGSACLSILISVAGSGINPYWGGPNSTLVAGTTYQFTGAIETLNPVGNLKGVVQVSGGVATSAGVSATSWTPASVAYTPSVNENRFCVFVAESATTGTGILYFDYATIVLPNTPNNVMFRSLGTDALGSLAAWTKLAAGTATISGNVATGTGVRYQAGHPDWTDITLVARFQPASASMGIQARLIDNNNNVRVSFTTGGVRIEKILGGVYTQVQTAAAQWTANSWYWVIVGIVGTTYTATFYKDAGGYIGDQLAQVTATIADTIFQSGAVGFECDGGQPAINVGGPYPNVFLVQSNMPTGWGCNPPLNVWTSQEPAFCWSKSKAYYGTFSASIYIPAGQSTWQGKWHYSTSTFNPGATGKTYRLGSAVQLLNHTVGGGAEVAWDASNPFLGSVIAANTTTWTTAQVDSTQNAAQTPSLYLVGDGTAYFDNLTIVDVTSGGYSTAPSQVAFRSIGSDASGDLTRWTQDAGAYTIANNVIAAPATGGRMRTGHADWADCTVWGRFQFTAGSFPKLLTHYVDTNNFVQGRVDGTNLLLEKVVGNAFSGVAGTTLTLTPGAWYWMALSAAGTTFSVSIYQDLNGYLGPQTGVTVSGVIADSAVAHGGVGVGNSAGSACSFGGAYPNVFIVQTPMPTGYSFTINAGEPAACWSTLNPFSGSRSLSIQTFVSSDDGIWNAPNVTHATEDIRTTAQTRLTGSGSAELSLAGVWGSFTTNDGAWHAFNWDVANVTTPNAPRLRLLGGAGLVYFDAASMSQINAGVADQTANAQTGTLANGVTVQQPGAITDGDLAMTFDGVAGQVVLPTTLSALLADDISFEAWAYVSQNPAVNMAMASMVQGSNWLVLWMTTSRQLNWRSASGSTSLDLGSVVGAFSVGAWHHVVATRRSSDGQKCIYVDGQLVASRTGDPWITPGSGKVAYIGGRTNDLFWNGSVDEVAIYPVALTAAQVQNHYNAGVEKIAALLTIGDAAA